MPLAGPEIVRYERKDQIAYIILNRPERLNAISKELGERLDKAWAQFSNDDKAKVAILTGVGDKAFCAGLDMKERAEQDKKKEFPEMLRHWEGLNIEKPTIAAINGLTMGGGWKIAQDCDIRIAAEHAEFAVSEVKWGRGTPWAMPLLWMIPFGVLMEMLLTGESISAERAYEIGFVNSVVKKEDLMTESTRMAEVIRDNAPLSVKAVKETFYKARDRGLGCTDGLQMAKDIWDKVYQSEDARNGPKAFTEKKSTGMEG